MVENRTKAVLIVCETLDPRKGELMEYTMDIVAKAQVYKADAAPLLNLMTVNPWLLDMGLMIPKHKLALHRQALNSKVLMR